MSAPLNSQQFGDQQEPPKKARRRETVSARDGYGPVAFVGYGVGYVGVNGGYGGGAMTTTGVSGGQDPACDAGVAATGGTDGGSAGNGDVGADAATPST